MSDMKNVYTGAFGKVNSPKEQYQIMNENYSKICLEFAGKATIRHGIWDGKGQLRGSLQRTITYDNKTVIINIDPSLDNVEFGQLIDYYVGDDLKGFKELITIQQGEW